VSATPWRSTPGDDVRDRPRFGRTTRKLDNVMNDIEHITGSSFADNLTGSGRANSSVIGLEGDDVLTGQIGNDTLIGGPGFDTLDGGPGFDFCDVGPDGGTAINCESFPSAAG
jgi:Ca2+-binding RTX toxin-like protein